MPITPEKDKVPCVLFPYNRPDKFIRVVSALKSQKVDHIIVFVDGPKDNTAAGPVEECRRIAGAIDWTGVDCIFKDRNEGPAAFLDNIGTVLQSYSSAIILEEDCLPMPSFYSVIKGALRHYRDDRRVFSIGAYQQLRDDFFKSYPYTFVSSLRYMCWGSAVWRDRWDLISPFFSRGGADLKDLANVPDTAGDDLASFARDAAAGGRWRWDALSWDIKIAILALHFNKVHLLTTRGLVKNIGLDSGIHGISDQAMHMVYNRNLYHGDTMDIAWLDDTKPDDRYNARLKLFTDSFYAYLLEKAASDASRRTPLSVTEIIAKAPSVLAQMGHDPIRTTKKIAARVFGRRFRPLPEITGRRNIRDYREHPVTTGNRKTKRALLSYLVLPLACPRKERDRRMFSNLGIAQDIPRALNELGYIVDIVNYDDRNYRVRKEYDLFVGHGGINFESIFRQLSPDSVKIYFSSGAYWRLWNDRSRERFEALLKRRGVFLPYDRYIYNSEEFANCNADGIICIGNDRTQETYSRFPLVVSVPNAAFPDEKYDYGEKDFEQGRNNFLFYSGPGNVHKGLDLLLDVFQRTTGRLYICTTIEPLFEKAFFRELHDLSNIHLIGKVHIHNPAMYPVVNRCNFVIHPSCSEGQPGSVIECMHKGLIPIVSRESNIDTNDFGITLKDCSVDEILRVVREVSDKSPEWCKQRSEITRNSALCDYTEEAFLKNMKEAVGHIVDQTRELRNSRSFGDSPRSPVAPAGNQQRGGADTSRRSGSKCS